MKTIEIEAARTMTDVENGQSNYIQTDLDTIKQAKERAKYLLSDEYQRRSEMSRPFQYARILVNGECHSDFFRKGYNGEASEE